MCGVSSVFGFPGKRNNRYVVGTWGKRIRSFEKEEREGGEGQIREARGLKITYANALNSDASSAFRIFRYLRGTGRLADWQTYRGHRY